MGRRLKLTQELQSELCTLIRKACPIQVACAAVGVSKSSYYRWLSEGEKEEAARQKAAEQGPEWVTTKEAEALTGFPVATLRKHARAGEFKAKKQGGRWLLDRAGLLLWAAPEGSPYLRFLEDIRQAEAEAEAHLVEFWQEQTPKDWRAARDLLARRFPERWSERQLIEADVRADARVQAQAGLEVSGKVEHEFTKDEVRGALQRFRDFLLREAIDSEQQWMDIQEALTGLGSATVEKLAELTPWTKHQLDERLEALAIKGLVKKQGSKWALTWTPEADDDQDQAEEPDRAAVSAEPVMTLKPYRPPPGRGPVLAGKTEFAKRRDGEI